MDDFHAYLLYDPQVDYVVNLDRVYERIGFAQKEDAESTLLKHLVEAKDYIIQPVVERTYLDGIQSGPTESIMMTVRGFKQLCMASNSESSRRVMDDYLTMENVKFAFGRRQLVESQSAFNQQRQELEAQLEAQQTLVALRESELSHIRTKVYEEVAKLDHVYINKEASELASNAHKIGRAIHCKKREAQLNTGSAQGSRMIYKRPTHNAKIIEDIVRVVNKRYHIASIGGVEHYNNNVEHSVAVIDIAATLVDTLASSFEYMKPSDLLKKVIGNLVALQKDGECLVAQDIKVATNPLHEFLAMDHDDRGCRITQGDGYVTSHTDLKNAFEKRMGSKFTMDVATLRLFGFKSSGDKREQVCKTCKHLAHSNCCVGYSTCNRIKKTIIHGMKLEV